jgi:two-component SAPR family response regulator
MSSRRAAPKADNFSTRAIGARQCRHTPGRRSCIAASFWRGAGEALAVVRREGLKDQYLFVLERLAEAALQARDYEVCMLHAQRLLEEDRCRESRYRLLMVCHAQVGQRARVRSWYELCVQTLRVELGVAPEDATTATYRELLGSHN